MLTSTGIDHLMGMIERKFCLKQMLFESWFLKPNQHFEQSTAHWKPDLQLLPIHCIIKC